MRKTLLRTSQELRDEYARDFETLLSEYADEDVPQDLLIERKLESLHSLFDVFDRIVSARRSRGRKGK